MHEIFKQDLPAIFLVQTVYTYAITDKMNGVTISALPDEAIRFSDLPNWYLKTKHVLK